MKYRNVALTDRKQSFQRQLGGKRAFWNRYLARNVQCRGLARRTVARHSSGLEKHALPRWAYCIRPRLPRQGVLAFDPWLVLASLAGAPSQPRSCLCSFREFRHGFVKGWTMLMGVEKWRRRYGVFGPCFTTRACMGVRHRAGVAAVMLPRQQVGYRSNALMVS